MDYENKYIKYKNKYIKYKNNHQGGAWYLNKLKKKYHYQIL